MPYDGDFYGAYQEYLSEPTVRAAHDWVFQVTRLNPAFDSVIDLGCGRFNEFLVYAKPKAYLGVDLNVDDTGSGDIRVLRGDYRKTPLPAIIGNFKPTALVSLF